MNDVLADRRADDVLVLVEEIGRNRVAGLEHVAGLDDDEAVRLRNDGSEFVVVARDDGSAFHGMTSGVRWLFLSLNGGLRESGAAKFVV